MNRKALAILLVVGVAAAVTGFYVRSYWLEQEAARRNISVSAAKALIESNPGLVILDVRTSQEYSSRRLKNAVNIPLTDLEQRISTLDRNSLILVYCETGQRSVRATALLAEAGFASLYNMQGGLSAWVEAGY